jgi:glucose-6-phosphate isomerase
MSFSNWDRFSKYFVRDESTGFSLDVSRMHFDDDLFTSMHDRIERAQSMMASVESGGIANPDEKRMVGHYWLRTPSLAPDAAIRSAIASTNDAILKFASDVHSGAIKPPGAPLFKRILLVGIGGSALGPQFLADALADVNAQMSIEFLDNTDPDGMQRLLARLGAQLGETLVIVISKSGGTKETRNGMLETAAAYSRHGLDFAKHAVAVTGEGSELDKLAASNGWIARFPMWDWVGGRTSVMSAAGLLPMALQAIDIRAFLDGAATMDKWTRTGDASKNPAMLLALMWFCAGHGHGQKDMVVLPYKDRLVLFSKYLQQLVMESLGKELDLEGRHVNQGIAVYGNKGSTDQHAYVQQLRDGVNNFHVTFLEVGRAQDGEALEVEPGITSGDYLQGFLRGTRAALSESDRESMTLTIPAVDAFHVGGLIALYERAVGLYAGLINVNAYHQPGVEAGKKAATRVLKLQESVVSILKSGVAKTASEFAGELNADPEDVYHILQHLASNGRAKQVLSDAPAADRFSGI